MATQQLEMARNEGDEAKAQEAKQEVREAEEKVREAKKEVREAEEKVQRLQVGSKDV